MLKLEDVFTMQNIIIYIVCINIIGFFVMCIDKQKAKKGKWRIKEQTLFYITLVGGGIGTITGMYLFRHKTKKLRFTIGFPVIVVSEIILAIYIISKYVI